jgi:hypothetical protein
VAGFVKSIRGSDVKGWAEHLLGFVQLGLGQVIAGLLEGLLVGPDDVPIRKRIRAVLKRIKASKAGPVLVPTSNGQASGFRGVKLGLKGNGLGWSFKPKKDAVSGPTKLASEVRLPSSSRRPLAEELKLAVEVPLGASDAEISVPELEVGVSPLLSMLPECEVCVAESDGDGPSMGEPIPLAGALEVPPVSALEILVVDFPLGTDRDELIVGCPVEDGLLNDSELTSPVSTQVVIVQNLAQAMGLLRQGFLGLRSPSPAPSSLGCKAAPVNGSVSSLIPEFLKLALLPRRHPCPCRKGCIPGG